MVGPTIIIWERAALWRLFAAGGGVGWKASCPFGLGAGVLRPSKTGLLDFLECIPTIGAIEADRAKPSVSGAGGQSQSPNLAISTMGAASAVLPEQWQGTVWLSAGAGRELYDPEAYAGTCYKASNLGSGGHERRLQPHRADFYIPTIGPSGYGCARWCRRRESCCAGRMLPQDCRKGLVAAPSGTRRSKAGATGVACWMCSAKLPTRAIPHTRYRIGPVLTIIAMALLAGRRRLPRLRALPHTEPGQRGVWCCPNQHGTERSTHASQRGRHSAPTTTGGRESAGAACRDRFQGFPMALSSTTRAG